MPQAGGPFTVGVGGAPPRPRLKRATEALRSGRPTGRFSPSRKVKRRRLGPQVRLPPLFTITGKTVGSAGAIVQPSRSAGGAGAATQAAGSGVPVGPGDGVGDAAPPQLPTASAAPRRRVAALALARRRGDPASIDGEGSRGPGSALPGHGPEPGWPTGRMGAAVPTGPIPDAPGLQELP